MNYTTYSYYDHLMRKLQSRGIIKPTDRPTIRRVLFYRFIDAPYKLWVSINNRKNRGEGAGGGTD